jgi:hypothetical protein
LPPIVRSRTRACRLMQINFPHDEAAGMAP